MQLVECDARPNWRQQVAELGYLSSIVDNPPYWTEALPQPFYCKFSYAEIAELIVPASKHLVQLAHKAVEFVCFGGTSEQQFDRLRVPREFRQAVRASWRRKDPSLYGRFDFCLNDGKLKLFELNFDVAASLYEASVLQWLWLKELKETGKADAQASQFNRLHEKLVARFQSFSNRFTRLHFASSKGFVEDEDTTHYIQSCAVQAGIDSKHAYMLDLGFDTDGKLVDGDKEHVDALFKFYPWEDFMAEELKVINEHGKSVIIPLSERNEVAFLEPLWRSLLSNKGILAIMYELEPECPWLLESHFEDESSADELRQRVHVRKPIFGREGGSVSIIHPDAPERSITNPSAYGREGFIVQEYFPLPKLQNYYVVVGGWVVGDEPAGVGIRADLSPVTSGSNCLFVPHQIG